MKIFLQLSVRISYLFLLFYNIYVPSLIRNKNFAHIIAHFQVKGLFRGCVSSIPRAIVGSASQLTSFEFAKQWLKKNGYFEGSIILQLFVASMIGGINVTIMMTPFDLVATRLYNQGIVKLHLWDSYSVTFTYIGICKYQNGCVFFQAEYITLIF